MLRPRMIGPGLAWPGLARLGLLPFLFLPIGGRRSICRCPRSSTVRQWWLACFVLLVDGEGMESTTLTAGQDQAAGARSCTSIRSERSFCPVAVWPTDGHSLGMAEVIGDKGTFELAARSCLSPVGRRGEPQQADQKYGKTGPHNGRARARLFVANQSTWRENAHPRPQGRCPASALAEYLQTGAAPVSGTFWTGPRYRSIRLPVLPPQAVTVTVASAREHNPPSPPVFDIEFGSKRGHGYGGSGEFIKPVPGSGVRGIRIPQSPTPTAPQGPPEALRSARFATE